MGCNLAPNYACTFRPFLCTRKNARKPREVKVNENSHSGEIVRVKDGNHAEFWACARHGAEAVSNRFLS